MKKITTRSFNQIFRRYKSNTALQLFLIYLGIVAVGTLLLMIPGVVHKTGVLEKKGKITKFSWVWIIALFNCCSSFSDTGLIMGSVADDYTVIGQIIMAILMLVGGLGVHVMITILMIGFYRLIKQKKYQPSYHNLLAVSEERGDINPINIRKIVFWNAVWLFVLILISSIVLWLLFFLTKSKTNNPEVIVGYQNWLISLKQAIFMSISAVNNAGLDIISGNDSLCSYSSNYGVQIMIMIDFVIGGLGFITWYELIHKIRLRKKPLSLFSRLNLIVYFIVAVLGVALVCGIESEHPRFQSNNSGDFFMKCFFNTMSTRNAGFRTIDIDKLHNGSKMVHVVMMFIGSAPSSTAGGIRTTTLGVLVLNLWTTFKRKKQVLMGPKDSRRAIDPNTISQSGMILFASMLLFSVCAVITVNLMTTYKSDNSIINPIYMLASAFGTVGLNPFPSIIHNPSAPAQVIVGLLIILLMFAGQLGMGNILVLRPQQIPSPDYPIERIRVG